MSRDRELERRLRELRVPGEAEAEERSREIVRSAYTERTPLRPTYRARRLTLALAAGAALLAIGLSPAGAKVGDLVSDVAGIGEEDAKPALRSLPAAGELLVESDQGPWIVHEDGSKRLLGDYEQATWSPRGLFVAVTDGRELIAVDPAANVRWTITAPMRVSDPRWSPSGFRIAYRSGEDLRVVAGDGTGDELVARRIASIAPAWRPVEGSKLATGAGGSHVLTYVDRSGRLQTVNVESGEGKPTTGADRRRIEAAPSKPGVRRTLSPAGSKMATIERAGATSRLFAGRVGDRQHILFSARGDLTGPTWSPDGRWLLVGWPAAEQWLFIPTRRSGKVVAIDSISEQFDPGGTGEGSFPRVSGWILPQR